ncbi:CMP-N-acetylneuraminate-poly-alpha-2,8-sialyltransferase-like [Branchiostoma lanceolatum]|uniref:CMP-N-acetylneuraminate-poly-alpha-2, 8-sialyltransferase-like n=1 Tax=Branchiostoma lanceolatum TaxID=7740 RepID=UPI003454BD4A
MRLEETCNRPRMFRGGMVLLFVFNLVMLYLSWRKLSTYAEPRFHLKKSTGDPHDTPQRTLALTGELRQAKQLSGPGIAASENRCKRCFNSTEVQNIRQHILKFYNPETNLTLTKSTLQIGRRLKYEISLSNKVTVTKAIMKLIPNESPLKNRHFNTCAVVGNSGVVLNSTCGQEIDSMDFVIRCNLPQIEGYEKDVGSKANFTTMNPSVVPQNFGRDYNRLLGRLKQVGDQILYVPALTSPNGERDVRVISQIVLQRKLPVKTAFPPAGINNLVKSIWTDAGFDILRPSTGVHMYTLAATICDQIHLYGFYPFSEDTRGRALRYHYYDTETEMINNGTHNMPGEFRVFQQHHQRGAVVLHTEPCH